MINSIKNFKFTTQFYVFSPISGMVLISSCQDQFDESVTPKEEVTYQYDQDNSITVILGPEYNQSRIFSTLDEYYDFANQIDNSGEKIIVNKEKYESLIHYFEPIEIYVLNDQNIVTVGDEEFKATREALYKRKIGDAKWEMDIYYGLTGEVDLNETELIHKHKVDLSALEDYEFKSPASVSLYERLKNEEISNARVQDKEEGLFVWKQGETPYTFKFRKQKYGDLHEVNIRWYCWHEEYSSWGAKTKGGTVTQWKYEWNAGGWTNFPTSSSPLGAYHENNEADTTTPYTWVELRVDGSDKRKAALAWSVSLSGVKRKSGTQAYSRHRGKIRLNNQNSITEIMSDFEVKWHGVTN